VVQELEDIPSMMLARSACRQALSDLRYPYSNNDKTIFKVPMAAP